MSITEELRVQISEWRKQQDQLEEMIEEAYKRIDIEEEAA